MGTVEDFQDRQKSSYSSEFGYKFDGKKLADAIPFGADTNFNTNPKAAAAKVILESTSYNIGSSYNEEFNAGKKSANREDSTSIFAEAKCTVYRAKLNLEASPPLLQEVKDWIFEMLDLVKGKEFDPLSTQILKFIDYYGTHIVTEADFGARYMYNFTLTAKNEAEIYDQFGSFSSAVDNSFGFLGFSITNKKKTSGSEDSKEFKSNFDKLVETTVSSVGAPLPLSSSDGTGPDPAEWEKNVSENPVPIKLSLVSIERILDNKEFVDLLKCKNYETAHVETLREHFRLIGTG